MKSMREIINLVESEISLPRWFLRAKVCDISKTAPDADYILEPEEFDYEWRLCHVPISALSLEDNWAAYFAKLGAFPEELARFDDITEWINDAGGIDLALRKCPLIVILDGTNAKLIDGWHRAGLAKYKFDAKLVWAVVAAPDHLSRKSP